MRKEIDRDPWGTPYRILVKNVGRLSPDLALRGHEKNIADGLFPVYPIIDWSIFSEDLPTAPSEQSSPSFTADELREVAYRTFTKRVSGPDGVPNVVVFKLARSRTNELLKIYNICLKEGQFPDRWNEACVVLLLKGPSKSFSSPCSCIPICLLDTMGKILKRLLLKRINEAIGRLSERQFGFHRGHSTMEATRSIIEIAESAGTRVVQKRNLCPLVTLDDHNAFISVPWIEVDRALRRKFIL